MKRKKKVLLAMMAALTLTLPLTPQGEAKEEPDTVQLGSLADLYEPVSFDHSAHVEIVEGKCAICHHHTTGTRPIDEKCIKCHAHSGQSDKVACKDCHPADRFSASYLAELESDSTRYHVDKPGLKGAYHQRCLGCHTEMDAPTGCQDCHARTERGEKIFHAGKYAPAKKVRGHGE